ncbi:MAG: S8 family serine peptidase, partial [Candidatus Zixiibacteriota bacterium]
MKKTVLLVFLSLLILPFSGMAQSVNDLDGANSSTTDREEPKSLNIPFRLPPPAYIQYVPNEMVVLLETGINETSIDARTLTVVTGNDCLDELNKRYGVTVFKQEFPDPEPPVEFEAGPDLSRYYLLKFSEEYRLEEVLKAYESSDCVETAEPIGVHPVFERIPNDPRFLTDQWNFYDLEDNDVDATAVWDYETGDEGVILGLLDTGLQWNSPDLGGSSPYIDGNVWINWPEYEGVDGVDDDGNGYIDDWIGWDFVTGVYNVWPGEDSTKTDNDPSDFNGHGTHVAGIMGAITNNDYMVAGLAGGWNVNPGDPANGVKIMALRIGWSAPHPIHGYEVGYVRMDFAAQAIYYAVNKGVTAVNCSWGSSNTGGLGAAVSHATANGVLVVAAAGNDGDSYPDYLGTREDVINVCATNENDIKPYWSDYGTWVDISAPGDNIISTYSYHYNPYYVAWLSGTSQSCPHVVGAAGILKSYADTLDRDHIESLLIDYTDDIDHLNPSYAGLMGSGRLNVFKSLDAVEAPAVTVIQPNGGEVLYIGQVYTVMWDATDNVGIA